MARVGAALRGERGMAEVQALIAEVRAGLGLVCIRSSGLLASPADPACIGVTVPPPPSPCYPPHEQEPKPVPDPAGLQQLAEGLGAARAWLQRAHAFSLEGPPADLAALEACVAEASALPVALPEAQALRERAAAARRLADALRAALPEGHQHSVDQVR